MRAGSSVGSAVASSAAMVAVRINAGIQLVGDVALMRVGIGGAVGAAGGGGSAAVVEI